MNQRHPSRTTPRTAIIYDFDGTLARGNLQERKFLPQMGIKNPQDFWNEVNATAKASDTDNILTYMCLMIEKADRAGRPVTAAMLRDCGQKPELFPGLDGERAWFERINDYAAEEKLTLEHYVISSGIEEMIDGCPIRDVFTKVYASKFIYRDGKAIWPGVGINYTTKTQYLFRINKGIHNHWDSKKINDYVPEHERPLPFSRMIFIGDGETDIPSMKMMNYQGGHSIAVYDPEFTQQKALSNIHRLISDDRVNFVAPADYRAGKPLEIIVKGILGRIARKSHRGNGN